MGNRAITTRRHRTAAPDTLEVHRTILGGGLSASSTVEDVEVRYAELAAAIRPPEGSWGLLGGIGINSDRQKEFRAAQAAAAEASRIYIEKAAAEERARAAFSM